MNRVYKVIYNNDLERGVKRMEPLANHAEWLHMELVEQSGIEPPTSGLQSPRSPN